MLVYLYTPTSSPPASVRPPSLTPARTSTDTPTPQASPSPTIPIPRPTHTSAPAPPAASPLSTPTSESTGTPPSPTPTPSLLSRLRLAKREQICKPGQAPHIEVLVRDERGAGLPGVEVWLMWSGGADRAVTGLKPQNGAGYVDFSAERGVPGSLSYAIGVGELGMPLVTDLRIEPCPGQKDEEPLLGSWRIVLEPQPLGTE
jgi:hypothetical protein